MSYMQITLRLISIYMMVMGVFALLFQEAGKFLYLFHVVDPVITRMWGGALIGISIFYLLISYDVEKHKIMLWAGLLHLTISFLITVYHMGTRMIDPSQGMVRIIVTPIFLIIILSGIFHKKKEKVLFEVSGERDKKHAPSDEETRKGTQEQHPEHIREHHPLYGK